MRRRDMVNGLPAETGAPRPRRRLATRGRGGWRAIYPKGPGGAITRFTPQPPQRPSASRPSRNGNPSGHLAPHRETRRAPAARVEDSRHPVDGLPNRLEAEIERGEPEADHVGGAEIADHPVGDERLAELERVGVPERDVAAPLLGD